MHELSIAISLLDVVTETMIKENCHRATSVTVEIGDLSGVVPEALQTAFRSATRDTDLKDCELIITPVAVAVRCDACNSEHPARAANDLTCSACGQPAPRIVRGRELDVVQIEMDDDAAPNP